MLSVDDMRLLSTLPALASLVMKRTKFEGSTEDTLRQWMALTASSERQNRKRKAEQIAQDENEDELESNMKVEETAVGDVKEEDAR